MGKRRPSHYAAVRSTGAPAPAPSPPRGGWRGVGYRRSARRRRQVRAAIFSAVGTAILAAAVVLAVVGHGSSAGFRTSPTNWSLPTLNGKATVTLASLKGRPTVVNFFASWCRVCAAELPVFAHDAVALRGRVNVIEVNALETGDGSAFAEQFHLARDVTALLKDVGGAQGDGLYQSLGGSGSLPMTAFYDAAGHLITTHIGGYDAATLAEQLRTLYGTSATP